MTSWRDVLKIHPAAELFPMMGPDELMALGKDLKANGMAVPITVLHGQNGAVLLDGRNRLAALEMVGCDLPVLTDAARDGRPKKQLSIHYVAEKGVNAFHRNQVDSWAYVLSTNIQRRHPHQRAEARPDREAAEGEARAFGPRREATIIIVSGLERVLFTGASLSKLE